MKRHDISISSFAYDMNPKKVKHQGHSETTCSNKHFGGGWHFLTYHWNVWRCFNETYHVYSLSNLYDTDDIPKVMSSKVKVTDYFAGGGIPIDGLSSKTISIIWQLDATVSDTESVCRV